MQRKRRRARAVSPHVLHRKEPLDISVVHLVKDALKRSVLARGKELVTHFAHLARLGTQVRKLPGALACLLGGGQLGVVVVRLAKQLAVVRWIGRGYARKEPALGPHNAVHGRRGGRTDRTHRVRCWHRMCCAVVALGVSRADRLHLAKKAGGAAFDRRYVGHNAHAVHPSACFQIVQCAQHDVKRIVEGEIKLGRLDVSVVRDDRHVGVECARTCLRNDSLGLFDMLLLEEKLSIEIR